MQRKDIITELQDLRYLSWSKIRNSSGTAGSFLKAYEIVDGKKTYYKLSAFDPVNGITGHECVNEKIVDRLLDVLGVEHLHYRLVHALISIDDRDYETWLSASEDFKEAGDSKMALDDYYEMNRIQGESPLDFCLRMGWGEYFYTMLVVDYLIINRDRHGANIEILKNKKTGKVRLAPLFDHGLSFVCRCASDDEVKQFDPMEDRPVQSFIGSGSAENNLALIPRESRTRLRKLEIRDRNILFAGLEDALPQLYQDKIWDIIWERWNHYEDLQNNR